jgi:hypothetical protein
MTLTAAGRLATHVARVTPYRPWSAQRIFHDSRYPVRVVVAGRQSGKTHSAAEDVVRLMLKRPGTTSCLLMPTYKSTKGPLKHLRRALRGLLGEQGQGGKWRWFEVDKVFRLFNGAELYVRTADDKEGVPTRGLTVDGVLWIDEAAYVPEGAVDAARFTQAAVADPRVIITTSPAGKNWVFREFSLGQPGKDRSPLTESFRFRSVDSPYCTKQFVEDLKSKVGARKAMQELNAEFLGDANACFDPDDLAKLFVGTLPLRGEQLSIGLDLGKEQDYTVLVLMNEFGEAWVLGRWRRVKWDVQEAQVSAIAQSPRYRDCIIVIDDAFAGSHMADFLARRLGESRILRVSTDNHKVKGEIIETLKADVENGRLRVAADSLGNELRHEMTWFEEHTYVVGGVQRSRYHAPEGSGSEDEDGDDRDHDDCVISLALANWGRVHGWEKRRNPCAGDWSGFSDAIERDTGPAVTGEFGDWGPLA